MAIIKVTVDYPTIQAAVDAASSGDIILVESGIYHEQVTISTSYLQIIGEKGVVLDGQFRLGTAFTLNNVNGVKIKSFKIINYLIDAVYINRGANNVIIKNVIRDNSNSGIELYYTPNTKITGNIINGTGYYGIYNYQSHNARIENNIISSNGSVGIYFSSNDSNGEISNNSINYNGYGILDYGDDSRILSNKVYGNSSYGIYVYSNALVKGNEAEGNLSEGIYISGQNNTIEENQACLNERNGIYITTYGGSYNTISENYITRNKLNGLYIGSTLNVVTRNTSRENKYFDIVRLRPNNYLKGNECETSNPQGLCESCKREEHPDVKEVL